MRGIAVNAQRSAESGRTLPLFTLRLQRHAFGWAEVRPPTD
jgi:hypothetical protein